MPVELATSSKSENLPLPVTLLSGFLGSGKTTLLQHILTNKQNLKCAVIVNDMASINIDATLVGSFVQHQEEKLVKMQNGCICCTLRGDLMEAVGKLAKQHEFDYLIIESTGISEPMQVAETFGMKPEDLADQSIMPPSSSQVLESLQGLAKLDTCVTVVDVSNLLEMFDEAKFLAQKFQGADKNDERTVTDLLCDQIEFANVIMLNKVDLIKNDPKKLEKCRNLVKTLNPNAKIFETIKSNIDLSQIINTKLFDMGQASMAPGWLMSLKETIVPETIEYGISSFVYRSRRPFHPNRLFELLQRYFIIIETPNSAAPEDEEMENEDDNEEMEMEMEMEEDDNEKEDELEDQDEDDYEMVIDPEDAKRRLKAKYNSPFKGLFRSKGFVWIATRPKSMGEWSQAGAVMNMINAGSWYCDLPRETHWPEDKEAVADILRDFDPNDQSIGDKRQEIVFIGQFDEKTRESMIKKLDRCLVTEKEWKKCQAGQMEDWEDPWEEWTFLDYIDEEEEEGEEE